MPAVTPTILSGGTALKPEYNLLSIDIRSEVERIPQAELRFLDGDATKGDFEISDAKTFEPGAKIEIKLRIEGTADRSLFKGIVVRHGVEVDDKSSVLIIGVKDEAVKLTTARKSEVYKDQKDSEIVTKIVSDAGLKAGTITATTAKHKQMVQYHATPWDFILSRASANGMFVAAQDGAISMLEVGAAGKKTTELTYGIDTIYELEIEADASHQFKSVQSVAWDAKQQKSTPPAKAADKDLAPGDLKGGKLGEALGNAECTLSHPVSVTEGEMKAWADGYMARGRMSLLRGRVAIPGGPDIKLLDGLEIAGVGKRFNGKTLVTGLRHRFDQAGWRMDLQFGLSPETLANKGDVLESPAAGLLPGVNGLQIGVVADFAKDDENELRVKVLLPGIDPEMAKFVWARLASPDAGKDRGFFFRPEPKDEVVVGFLNDDPRQAIILGSLYGSKNSAPKAMGEPTAKNEKRGIVSKKGTTIGFLDGDKAKVFIETAGKNSLILDDDEGKITLTDQNKNSITMSKDGIVVKSAKDFKIDASGNVEIKGSKVDVK